MEVYNSVAPKLGTLKQFKMKGRRILQNGDGYTVYKRNISSHTVLDDM